MTALIGIFLGLYAALLCDAGNSKHAYSATKVLMCAAEFSLKENLLYCHCTAVCILFEDEI